MRATDDTQHLSRCDSSKAVAAAVKAPSKAKVPANINRWINVYDEVDIFAYAAKPIFDRVDVDGRYDTQTYVIKAHGAYFDQARFYERLRVRVDQLP